MKARVFQKWCMDSFQVISLNRFKARPLYLQDASAAIAELTVWSQRVWMRRQ
jgi:3-methyladenine DNA glycosylase AlkC